jgi:hypothetical protein
MNAIPTHKLFHVDETGLITLASSNREISRRENDCHERNRDLRIYDVPMINKENYREHQLGQVPIALMSDFESITIDMHFYERKFRLMVHQITG